VSPVGFSLTTLCIIGNIPDRQVIPGPANYMQAVEVSIPPVQLSQGAKSALHLFPDAFPLRTLTNPPQSTFRT
jgi:hypothetical protein